MQYIWQFRLWPTQDMRTVSGERIVVLDPGLHNHDAGPDFFNAKVLIDGIEWVGNIEIHVKASDWFAHHHDTDPAYDSVVLHVVDSDDAEIHRADGQVIPQMVMKCAPDFSVRYNEMVNNTFRELPCGNEIGSVPNIYLTDWISALGFERLYEKADRITSLLDRCNGDWAETLYITLARALGFGTNSDPFELLATTTPLKHMLHYTDSLISIEAMLFGQAGLLEGIDPTQHEYIQRLVTEYRFLQAKFQLTPSKNIVWKMARMRPQNFPHRRIATLAKLIYKNILISNRVIEVADELQARRLFDIDLDDFWARHYNFTSESPTPAGKALSYSSTTVLLINVVAPMIFAYAQRSGNDTRATFAVELLHNLRPEQNHITAIFDRAHVPIPNAFTTQALIQLKRNYCDTRKCLYCRIGHRLLSAKVKR